MLREYLIGSQEYSLLAYEHLRLFISFCRLGWKKSDVEFHSCWCDLRFQEMTRFCYDQPCSTISCFFYWLIDVIFTLKSIGALRYSFAGLIFSCINEGMQSDSDALWFRACLIFFPPISVGSNESCLTLYYVSVRALITAFFFFFFSSFFFFFSFPFSFSSFFQAIVMVR